MVANPAYPGKWTESFESTMCANARSEFSHFTNFLKESLASKHGTWLKVILGILPIRIPQQCWVGVCHLYGSDLVNDYASGRADCDVRSVLAKPNLQQSKIGRDVLLAASPHWFTIFPKWLLVPKQFLLVLSIFFMTRITWRQEKTSPSDIKMRVQTNPYLSRSSLWVRDIVTKTWVVRVLPVRQNLTPRSGSLFSQMVSSSSMFCLRHISWAMLSGVGDETMACAR